MKKILSLILLFATISLNSQTGITPLNFWQWKTTGNALTTNTNFIGSTNARGFTMKSNNVPFLHADSSNAGSQILWLGSGILNSGGGGTGILIDDNAASIFLNAAGNINLNAGLISVSNSYLTTGAYYGYDNSGNGFLFNKGLNNSTDVWDMVWNGGTVQGAVYTQTAGATKGFKLGAVSNDDLGLFVNSQSDALVISKQSTGAVNAVIAMGGANTRTSTASLKAMTGGGANIFEANSGADVNYFRIASAGNLAEKGTATIGSTVITVGQPTLNCIGNIAATQDILSSGQTQGIGYATGSGSTVTQGTNRTTGVTINAINGAITLVSAAGLASFQTFKVTNTTVAATDVIVVNQKSGTDAYFISVSNVAAGSFKITFETTGGITVEQPVFNFAVIKAVSN